MSSMPDPLSLALIALMKGVTAADEDPEIWKSVVDLQARIREYVSVLGLELILDEAEGVAFLRQRPAREGVPELPRLVPRRQLSYPVSLLLALLRKKLAEFDALGGETRLVLGREDIVDLVRVFLPASTDEARLVDRIGTSIERVVEMGFLRRMRGQKDTFEVRRILKAFVDAQWLDELHRRLAAYAEHAGASASPESES